MKYVVYSNCHYSGGRFIKFIYNNRSTGIKVYSLGINTYCQQQRSKWRYLNTCIVMLIFRQEVAIDDIYKNVINILSEPLVNYVILWENIDLQFIYKKKCDSQFIQFRSSIRCGKVHVFVLGLQRFVDVINYVDYKNTSICMERVGAMNI